MKKVQVIIHLVAIILRTFSKQLFKAKCGTSRNIKNVDKIAPLLFKKISMSTTSTSENFITFKMSESLSSSVLVTGFGPFGDHKVNISWEVAKAVKDLNLETIGVKIILHEIPVAYSTVSKEVPLLWKKHKPKVNLPYYNNNH